MWGRNRKGRGRSGLKPRQGKRSICGGYESLIPLSIYVEIDVIINVYGKYRHGRSSCLTWINCLGFRIKGLRMINDL